MEKQDNRDSMTLDEQWERRQDIYSFDDEVSDLESWVSLSDDEEMTEMTEITREMTHGRHFLENNDPRLFLDLKEKTHAATATSAHNKNNPFSVAFDLNMRRNQPSSPIYGKAKAEVGILKKMEAKLGCKLTGKDFGKINI